MRRKMAKLSLAKETLRELTEGNLHPMTGGATLSCARTCFCTFNASCNGTCVISCVYTGCEC